ncbi:MAG: DUF924 family protein [Planctomycetes bacterium]|nr:DUF924 family protein [Planctomycetota bacterium]
MRQRWFGGGPAFDEEIRARFAELPDAAVESWEGDASLLAAVIVLDQLPATSTAAGGARPAYDARARALALAALERGQDRDFSPSLRAFLCRWSTLRIWTSKDRSVALFEALAAEAPPDDPHAVRMMAPFAHKHREQIRRFGRFPGRNLALGRADTEDEQAWFAQGAETFGQR